MRAIWSVLLFLFLLISSPATTFAAQNQFITITNPVRISEFKDRDAISSLVGQYKEVLSRKLPATWLFTYDVLKTKGLKSVTDSMDPSQEFGIWMEVTPDLAQKVGVKYNQTDSWHRSSSVFLSGYLQDERMKMVDTVFEEFKSMFGYYPKSVGAWWIEAYSLEYMSKKYGVIANLGVADQHSTDGYHVWGQYWGIPFYPSKLHSASPAQKKENKIDVVNLQWAPRDPLNGYGESIASLYSTQDWFVINLPEDYFLKLINLYGRTNGNQFGHIVLGLEGDFPPETYTGIFAREMEIIKRLRDSGEFQVTNMQDFASWYRKTFPEVSLSHLILSDDLMGKDSSSAWYQSPNYRIGLKFDKDKKVASVMDLRIYSDGYREPYYQIPNKDLDLYINLPASFDSTDNPLERWEIPADKFEVSRESGDVVRISLKNDSHFDFVLRPERIDMSNKVGIPGSVKKYPSKIGGNWPYPSEGLTFNALTLEAEYFLKGKKIQLGILLLSLVVVTLLIKIAVSDLTVLKKSLAMLVLVGLISPGVFWYTKHQESFYISPDELSALMRLSSLPEGKVMVADKNCLQCDWHSKDRPAAMANRREYVSKISKKPTVQNSSVFKAIDRPQAKQELEKLGIKYIYTVRYEDYQEKLPFSPGDLNVEMIFENANAQIWVLKD